jgi:hypothetical protein
MDEWVVWRRCVQECSLVSQVNRSRDSFSWVSLIESNHAIHFWWEANVVWSDFVTL